MSPLLLGLALVAAAVASLAFGLLADGGPRVSKDRRTAFSVLEPTTKKPLRVFAPLERLNKRYLLRLPYLVQQSELDAAGITRPIDPVKLHVLGAVLPALVGRLLFGSTMAMTLLMFSLTIAMKVYVRQMGSRRRKRFAGQLDHTLRIIASALRAGQSLPTAMSSVALDAEEPMRQELGRVVNEARVGRDLVAALVDTADRMRSEDLRWFAEAVEVQRDTGGNLNDIIDTVAETIRDRAEIREKVNAYASEGKASAFVLMALPIGLAVAYSVMNPGYLTPLVSTTVGVLLLLSSVVMYVVAFFWMRAIVNIKV